MNALATRPGADRRSTLAPRSPQRAGRGALVWLAAGGQKAPGELRCDTGGALDYATVEVAPNGGPPLHVHHTRDELIHAAKGRFKVQIGDETFVIEQGGLAYMPTGKRHAFLNLTDEPAELTMVFTPGGTHKFFEELGSLARAATPDRTEIAALFEKHDCTLLGSPLTAD